MKILPDENPTHMVNDVNVIILPQDFSESTPTSENNLQQGPAIDFSSINMSSQDIIMSNEVFPSQISEPPSLTDEPQSQQVSPDNNESNPDILKAELSFYATPHTADFGWS